MQTRPLLCSRVLRGELLVPRLLKRLLSHARFHPFRLLRSWPASASADKPSLTSDFAQYLPAIGVTLQDVAKARSWTVPPSRFEAQIAARAQKAPELSSNSSSAEAAAEVAVFMPAKTVFAAMRDEAKEAGEPRTSMELADALAHIQKQEERQAAASAAGRGQSPASDEATLLNYSAADAFIPEELEDVPALTPTLTTSPGSRYIPDLPEDAEIDADTAGLPYNLATLQENLDAVAESRRRFKDPYQRQRWLEESAYEAARKRLRFGVEQMEKSGVAGIAKMNAKQLQTWMWDWYKALEGRLRQDLAEMKEALESPKSFAAKKRSKKAMQDATEGERSSGINEDAKELYPLLASVSVGQVALIPVLELMRLLGTGGVSDGMKMTRACVLLGKAVETEAQVQSLKRRDAMIAKVAKGEVDGANSNEAGALNPGKSSFQIDVESARLMQSSDYTTPEARKKLKEIAESSGLREHQKRQTKWTQTMRGRVGSYLLSHLMDVATIQRSGKDREGRIWNVEQPAFFQTYQYLAGKRLGVIKVNDIVANRLDQDEVRETLHPRQLPMLVPPKPWIAHDSGGYYLEKSSAMRFKDSAEQSSYLRAASERGELDSVLAGLDILGQTPWRINRKVFDVISEIWNKGEGLAKIPPRSLDDSEPKKPANYDTDMKARAQYLLNLRAWATQKAVNHGLRCDINYKLEIARAFLGERIFFPHNIDFRGRAYPIPPNFNHIGNDLCRGLLKFDKRKPLGQFGLRWLRIHLANLYGFDKASLPERENWALSHEKEIRESVADPLGGSRWWLKADDPWQCLATCFELVEAYDHPEGPENYASNLPVHQDGTCNGLQHYAALGGDLAGAKQVNLAGGERPSDVYSGVAEIVLTKLEEDAEQGNELAKTLIGKITRKVVKQTVMTTVYGVTFVGAKKQIARQLVDRGDIDYDKVFDLSSYLAKTVLSSIGTLFAGATRIQRWLHYSARLVSKSIPPDRLAEALKTHQVSKTSRDSDGLAVRAKETVKKIAKEQMTSVIWTSALGLPVVQPYRKSKKRQMQTRTQSIYISDPQLNHEVSPKKQASAFPPNFIHSLDATHMLLTALECHRGGLTFASVHDSYWTHACDIDTMSDFIRETFVTLHSNDILMKLREEVRLYQCIRSLYENTDASALTPQFLERFGDYQVPVLELRSMGEFGAGEKSDVVEDIDADIVEHLAGEDATLSTLQEQGTSGKADEEAMSLDGEGADDETPPQSRRSRTKGSDPDSKVAAKFVPLREILPPLPPKGSFDVNEIRVSSHIFRGLFESSADAISVAEFALFF